MSTVTARLESAQRMGPLLVDQLTAPVRVTQAATGLVREGVRTFVEVGPGNVLSGLVKRIDKSVKAVSVNDLVNGKRIECKDIMEMLGAEEQIKEAARTFGAVLTAASQFGGEEIIEL